MGADKKKLVVILGAGASADFGVPTLGQLFKDHRSKVYLGSNSWLAKKLDEIFWKPRGHDLNTSEESLTVEEMLTILRDWEQENATSFKLTPTELALFRKSIYVLIYKALFEAKSSKKEHLNKLIEFARNNFDHTTWASFNWDCIFESSFWYSSGPPLVGHRNNPTLAIDIKGWWGQTSKHLYLKLHGSLNWWFDGAELKYVSFSGTGGLQESWSKYAADPAPTVGPVILEPSFYKYNDKLYSLLKPQWKVFLERLVEADYILTIGYSLPNADSQARCKMLTAFQANSKSLWGVIDPNSETLSRYRRLFGETRLRVFNGTLVGFNNEFQANFSTLFPTF